MPGNVYVGVDLGATAIKVGICNANGELLHKYETPTPSQQEAQKTLEDIADFIKKVAADAKYTWEQVTAVGFGIAGFSNAAGDAVLFSPNLGWRDIPVKTILEDKLRKNVRIDNDANTAALGEWFGGAGKGIKHLVCYTIGTGVGGGIVIDGKLYRGADGMAGEFGHMQVVPDLEAVQCGCGKSGCLETVSSATGIVRMARDAVARGDRTALSYFHPITAKNVFEAAKAGDEAALRIVRRAAFYLGKSMAAVAVVLNPRRMIIGGGVSLAGDIFLQEIRDACQNHSLGAFCGETEIVLAERGNDAGVIGAAMLHKQ